MKRQDHLLWILAEECAEVAHRASKAARFGIDEVKPGESLTNEDRLLAELNDLLAVVEMLQADGIVRAVAFDRNLIAEKKARVERYLEYSRECGTLEA